VTVAGLAEPGVGGWLVVVALLVLVRPGAVLISFAGSRMPRLERLFVAWFGVRGVGSFYYVAVAIGAGALSASEATTLYWTVIVCVGLSIILHGLSTTPASRRIGLDSG
jgi:NhaP-type Na+/H+ or K+/H+ antiporter